MNKKTSAAAHAHAIAEFPRESCGLIVARGKSQEYFPCKNAALTTSEHFVITAGEWDAAEDIGKVTGVVHSHPNETSRPSDADKAACEISKLPWFILSVYKNIDKEGSPPEVHSESAIAPSGWVAPLLGREFSFGILDCYTLIKDYYLQEMNIVLPDIKRKDKFWERGEDLYMKNFKKFGFSVVEGPVLPGDVIIMQIRATQANHAGVFLGDVEGTGSNLFLHHMYGQLSTRDIYGGYWAEHTRLIVRKNP